MKEVNEGKMKILLLSDQQNCILDNSKYLIIAVYK